ncbi:MarR family transcriptional regulator [Nocardia sp. NPDC050378]|uniref:MarR family winged helix-turn-helix transcriptional regulator n=1 Tax=Nocardia sp. NPDC050378 TaxID=3155400 RepID=UPI00340DF134
MGDTQWLDQRQLQAWVSLRAVLELLPGVLDAQLREDDDLTEFEYYTQAALSGAPDRMLRMSELAKRTNATLARLSHVVTRLGARGLVERVPDPDDGRVTKVRLTEQGLDKVRRAAPGHVATVRRYVIDTLSAEQVDQLAEIGAAILAELDPSGTLTATYTRDDRASE